MGNLGHLFFNQTSKVNITSTPSAIGSGRDYTVTSENGTVILQNVPPERISFDGNDQNNQIITYYADDVIINAAVSLEDISMAEFIGYVSGNGVNANTVISGKIHPYNNGTFELRDFILPAAEIVIHGDKLELSAASSASVGEESSYALGADDNESLFELRDFILPAVEIVISGDKTEFSTAVSASVNEEYSYALGVDDHEYSTRDEYSNGSPPAPILLDDKPFIWSDGDVVSSVESYMFIA